MHQRKIVGNNTHSNHMKRIKLKQIEIKKKKKSVRRIKKTTHQTRSYTHTHYGTFGVLCHKKRNKFDKRNTESKHESHFVWKDE